MGPSGSCSSPSCFVTASQAGAISGATRVVDQLQDEDDRMTPDEVIAEFRAAGALKDRAFHPLVRLTQPGVPAEDVRVPGSSAHREAVQGAGRENPRPLRQGRSRRLAGRRRHHPGLLRQRGIFQPMRSSWSARTASSRCDARFRDSARVHRIVMVEDIVTTGLSSRACLAAIADKGGEIAGRGLPDRPFPAARPMSGYPWSRLSNSIFRPYAPDACHRNWPPAGDPSRAAGGLAK